LVVEGLIWPPPATVHMLVVVELIVSLIVLLLKEAEAVRLTGIAVEAIMEDQVAVEVEVLLQIMEQVLEDLERLVKVMLVVLKGVILLLTQEEAVEVLELLVLVVIPQVVMPEVLERRLILQDLL
jgi:hypothetical protein